MLSRITAGRRLAREAAARPANLVLFDVLADAGDDLTGLPLHHCRARLEHLLVDAPPALLCRQTTDVELARTWFDELGMTGAEGLVIKDLAGYTASAAGGRPGGSTSVGSPPRRSSALPRTRGVLLLGRIDDCRRLRYVARTVPLALSQRHELGRMLTAATGGHPWPQPLPAAWVGQLDRREPQPYVRVEPLLVAEIVVVQVYDRGRYRHPIRHLRVRADLGPDDVERWRP